MGQNNLQEPTGRAAKTGIRRAASAGRAAGWHRRPGGNLFTFSTPPQPSPAAHNGVYGFGGEAPPDC